MAEDAENQLCGEGEKEEVLVCANEARAISQITKLCCS